MFTISVENHHGEILNLSESPMYDVLRIDGLSPPPATLNFSQMANFDGGKYNSGQLEMRNLVLTVKIYPDIETNRINLYKYFPSKKTVRIYYQNETRDVYIDGMIETVEIDPFTINETAQISILCPDPYWKERDESRLNFSNVISLFEFPFSIPEEGIEFSRLQKLTTAFFNNGEIETGFTIEFQATSSQILNPKFINRTTQEFFGLNVDMAEGDIIRINTRRGEKSVKLIRDGIETSIIGDRQSGSSWIQMAPGRNELSYECDNGSEYLIVSVYTHVLYGGV